MPQIDFEVRRGWFLDHVRGLEGEGFQTVCAFDPQGRLLGFMILNPLTHVLEQLAVAVETWGHGVASRLLAEARRLSPAALRLEVNADNMRALRFYEREGFVRIGESINPLSGLKTLRMQWQP